MLFQIRGRSQNEHALNLPSVIGAEVPLVTSQKVRRFRFHSGQENWQVFLRQNEVVWQAFGISNSVDQRKLAGQPLKFRLLIGFGEVSSGFFNCVLRRDQRGIF